MSRSDQSPFISEEFEEALGILALVKSGELPPIHEINAAITTLSEGIFAMETAVIDGYGISGDDGIVRISVDTAMTQLEASDMSPHLYTEGRITVDIHDDYSTIDITEGMVSLGDVRNVIRTREYRKESYQEAFR